MAEEEAERGKWTGKCCYLVLFLMTFTVLFLHEINQESILQIPEIIPKITKAITLPHSILSPQVNTSPANRAVSVLVIHLPTLSGKKFLQESKARTPVNLALVQKTCFFRSSTIFSFSFF